MKMVKFSDIKPFTRSAPYHADQPWELFIPKLQEDWIDELGLDIDPDFQRAHVWNETQQIRYVEYILRGGKSGRDLYFNHPNWMTSFKGPFVLVDGKQRLQAVRRFMNNEIKIFGDNKFSDFEDRLGYAPSFSVNVNDLKTRKEVLQWYIDLNAGGVAHTEDEIQKVVQLLSGEK